MNRTYFCIFRSAWRCFFFYWHPGEGSLMKCVWASVCEAHFEVNLFVLCLTCNRLFWKGRLSDWSSLIFSLCCVLLAFLCSSSHLRLSVSLFSDKTVKIWLSKVWRKRWQLKCSLCGPPCCFLSAWSATCSLRLKTQFPKQSRCFFFFVKVQNDKAEAEYVFKGKKTICLSDFFLMPIWKCHAGVILLEQDKTKRIFPSMETQGWTISHLKHENYRTLVLNGVLLFFYQGFRILVEQRKMNSHSGCVH